MAIPLTDYEKKIIFDYFGEPFYDESSSVPVDTGKVAD